MLYGTLKYYEPPIRLAKYEIDSHIFMHQVQSNNYTYEMAIKDFGKRKVDLLLSNGLIEKENGLMGLATLVGKTDVLGNTLWVKTNILYSSSSTQFSNRVKTITETNNGDLIVSGTINASSGNNHPEDYSYIFKYNTLGDSLWAKTYDDLSFTSLKIDENQNFIIASQAGINSVSSSSK